MFNANNITYLVHRDSDTLHGTNADNEIFGDLFDALTFKAFSTGCFLDNQNTCGRPNVLPCVRARSNPAFPVSRIIAHSNSVKTPYICDIALAEGVVVSVPC